MEFSISEIAQLWDKALVKIKRQLNENMLFQSVFSNTYIYEIRGNTCVVVGENKLSVSLLETSYKEMVESILRELTDSMIDVKFVTTIDIKQNNSPVQYQTHQQDQISKEYFKDPDVREDLTFEDFVVGDFNKAAAKAALSVAQKPGKLFNPLFIYSESGLGKTHLLHAIGNYVKNVSKPGSKIIYIHAMDFLEGYVRFVSGGGNAASQSLHDFVSSFDVLLFDDIQMLANRVKTQEMFFTIFEAMTKYNKQIVVTSDKQPSELNGIVERLITRVSMGLTVKIDRPDQNTCVKILKKKLSVKGYDINRFDEAALVLYAQKFSHNVRELEGALNRLMFSIDMLDENERVTLDVALSAIQDLKGMQGASTEINEQKIVNVVAEYYNVSAADILGKSRVAQIALARHISMYLIRDMLDVPYKRIGTLFGGKDHSSVMDAVSKVENMLKNDQSTVAAIEELKSRIKPE